jgi:hypothetical protein
VIVAVPSSPYSFRGPRPQLLVAPGGRRMFGKRRRAGVRGLGQSAQQIGGAVTNVAASVGGALIPIPGVGAAIGEIGSLITSLFTPDMTKINSSKAVQDLEPQAQQNLANWLSLPTSQRYASVQAAALSVFDQIWAQLQQVCTQIGGDGGSHCLLDRQQGACTTYTNGPVGWTGSPPQFTGGNSGAGLPESCYCSSWNCPNGQCASPPNSCWNWFIGYRDPIANDPYVQPDPVAGASTTSTSGGASGSTAASTGASSSDSSWLLWAGVAAAVVLAVAL